MTKKKKANTQYTGDNVLRSTNADLQRCSTRVNDFTTAIRLYPATAGYQLSARYRLSTISTINRTKLKYNELQN